MNVLVACEESQRVCVEFRKRGFEAFSCDLVECSGGHPEWHIKTDVLNIMNGHSTFTTQDGEHHRIRGEWDLIVAHPPCTYLTGAGAANIPKHPERIKEGYKAATFFLKIASANCDKIAIENPPPMKRFGLPDYDQIVRPYMFGAKNNKPICFWLKNLPPLSPVNECAKDDDMVVWIHKKTGKRKSCSKWYNTNTNRHGIHRSKTFPEVAAAIAEQWGNYLKGMCENAENQS